MLVKKDFDYLAQVHDGTKTKTMELQLHACRTNNGKRAVAIVIPPACRMANGDEKAASGPQVIFLQAIGIAIQRFFAKLLARDLCYQPVWGRLCQWDLDTAFQGLRYNRIQRHLPTRVCTLITKNLLTSKEINLFDVDKYGSHKMLRQRDSLSKRGQCEVDGCPNQGQLIHDGLYVGPRHAKELKQMEAIIEELKDLKEKATWRREMVFH